jgi:hypothetical protein
MTWHDLKRLVAELWMPSFVHRERLEPWGLDSLLLRHMQMYVRASVNVCVVCRAVMDR